MANFSSHLDRSLPLFGEVPGDSYTSGAFASADSTFVKLQLGTDDAVAARSDALPFDTDRAAERATLGPVYHLKTQDQCQSNQLTVPKCITFAI